MPTGSKRLSPATIKLVLVDSFAGPLLFPFLAFFFPPPFPPTPPPAPSLPLRVPHLTSPMEAALRMGRARRRDRQKTNNKL